MRKIACLLMFLLLIFAGCVPLISRELRRELSPDITFKQVIKDPVTHKGKKILISGIILGSRNTK